MLTSLPSEVGKLYNLKELLISSNQLSTLPLEIGNLINLSTINLTDNSLTNLPAELAKLNGLEKIQVYCYNDVTEQEVEELALIENFQRSEPSAVDTYHAIVSLIKKGKSVKEISLSLGMTKIHAQRMYLISQMPPKLIDYFLKGSISFETAAVLASYTSDKHKELLQYLDEAPDKNQIYQLDDFEDLFEKVYLGNVSFDLKDPELIPEMGACTKCMFGSIANEILKEVEGTSNICTNKPCADKKDEISALRSISANPLQVLTLCVQEDEYIGDKEQRIVSKLLENGYSKVVYQSDEPYVFLNDDGSVIEDNAEDNGLADALENDTN